MRITKHILRLTVIVLAVITTQAFFSEAHSAHDIIVVNKTGKTLAFKLAMIDKCLITIPSEIELPCWSQSNQYKYSNMEEGTYYLKVRVGFAIDGLCRYYKVEEFKLPKTYGDESLEEVVVITLKSSGDKAISNSTTITREEYDE